MRTRRPVLTSLAAVVTLLLGASAAHAGGVVSADGSGTRVVNLLYSLDDESPTADDVCLPEAGGDSFRYETATLRVSVDGSYAIHDAQPFGSDGAVAIINESACTRIGDAGTRELRAGIEYQLVLRVLGADGEGAGQSAVGGVVITSVAGTTGTVTIDDSLDSASPDQVGDHEVTGNGTNLATIDYTTDSVSPTVADFPQEGARPCDENGVLPGETAYETVRMQVSESGDYRFRTPDNPEANDVHGVFAIHRGDVIAPDGPGCIATTDASESVPLEAGVTYTVFMIGNDDSQEPQISALGRWVVSVTPDEDFDGRVTFLAAQDEIDEAVVCAPGGEVPAGYTVIEGTSRNDTLVGTSGNDVVRGLVGNDTIRGLGGDDILCGGAGNDTLEGGPGEDVLFGEAGNDALNGGAGDDVLVGAAGNDRLDGGAGSDVGFDRVGNNTILRVESRELPERIIAR